MIVSPPASILQIHVPLRASKQAGLQVTRFSPRTWRMIHRNPSHSFPMSHIKVLANACVLGGATNSSLSSRLEFAQAVQTFSTNRAISFLGGTDNTTQVRPSLIDASQYDYLACGAATNTASQSNNVGSIVYQSFATVSNQYAHLPIDGRGLKDNTWASHPARWYQEGGSS